MMKIITNDKLEQALKSYKGDLDSIYNDYINDMDDEQLSQLDKFNQLSQLDKYLLYLRANYKQREVAEMFNVSAATINNRLNRIYEQLK